MLGVPIKLETDEDWEAFERQLARYTVSVNVFPSAKKARHANDFVQGSGVLIELQDAFLVATCKHLFPDGYGTKHRVLIPPYRSREYRTDALLQDSVTLNPVELPSGRSHPGDLAMIVVDPKPFVDGGHEFFKLRRLPGNVDNACTVVASGAPGELGELHPYGPQGLHIIATHICRYGEMRTDITWSDSGESVQDILSTVMESSPLLDGDKILEAPESYAGMSGGGLWSVLDDGLWLLGLTLREDSTRFEAVNINRWIDFATPHLDGSGDPGRSPH